MFLSAITKHDYKIYKFVNKKKHDLSERDFIG